MRSMTDQTSGKHLELNDDGSVRRKYELEEMADGKIVVRSVIGFVLVSAFVMIKNVLFGAAPAQAAPAAATAGDRLGQVSETEEVAPEPEALVQDRVVAEDEEVLPVLGAGTRIDTSNSVVSIDPNLAPIRFGRGSGGQITSSNDNEQLYGARPGRAIGLTADAIDVPRQHGGGGGSRGGSSDPSGSGGGDGSDDDDDDDGHGGPDTGGDNGGNPNNPDTPRQNRLPLLLGPVVLVGLMANEARALSPADLLVSASDPDGDALSIRNLRASSGSVEQRADGTWIFTPEPDDTSSVTFTYQVSDGKGSVVQTASMDLLPRPVTPPPGGTPGSGAIVGTPGLDILDGTSGDDVIIGLEGDDIIHGGDGNDRIVAGDGDDVVFAGKGDDVVFGGDGNDVLWGGDGDDKLFGEKDNDVLIGEGGNDTLVGDDGDDIGIGGDGNDHVELGKGSDTIIATLSDGDDTYDGGEGNDTYNTAATSAGVDIDLSNGTSSSAETGHDRLKGIENVISGGGDDTITGSDGANVVTAGGGSDTVILGGGDDTAIATAGDGNDRYDGGEGHDTYDMGTTTADAVVDLAEGTVTSADVGSDTIAGFENVVSGGGDDTITGTDNANVVTAGAGDDTVNTGGGDDTIVACADDGDDAYDGGTGSDTYDASATNADAVIDLTAGTASSSEIGDDTMTGIENVVGSGGDDTIIGSEADNVVEAGLGDDTVTLGDGNDTVVATSNSGRGSSGDDNDRTSGSGNSGHGNSDDGDDRYEGGDGEDTYDISGTSANALIDLIAQSASSLEVGRDLISSFENVSGGKGNDVIVASDSRNIIIGGGGDDTFVFHSSASIGRGHGSRDKIMDFSVGDRIDIDHVREEFAEDLSDSFKDQDIQRFVLIGQQDTFVRPGEMKIRYESLNGETVTILEGNTDFDSEAEFELEFAGVYQLTDDDFSRTV